MMLRKRRQRLFFGIIILLIISMIAIFSFSALSASNVVPPTRLGMATQVILIKDLIPVECANITFDRIINCVQGVKCLGGTGNSKDLIFGTPYADDINGGNGSDCILGGGGNDTIDGGPGSDVCQGGPGTNNFERCEVILP
jgi:hypothetical protein